MGMQTVAEFFENTEILRRVRALGVNYVQGYGIAPRIWYLKFFGENIWPVPAPPLSPRYWAKRPDSRMIRLFSAVPGKPHVQQGNDHQGVR